MDESLEFNIISAEGWLHWSGVQTFKYIGLSRYWENIFLGFFWGISILHTDPGRNKYVSLWWHPELLLHFHHADS